MNIEDILGAFKAMKNNPYLGGYIKESLINEVLPRTRVAEKEKARIAASYYPIAKASGGDTSKLVPYVQNEYGENYDESIPFLAEMAGIASGRTGNRESQPAVLGGYAEEPKEKFIPPLNPLVTTPKYYTDEMLITRKNPQGVTWTRAPLTEEGFPQDLVDKATSYVYSNTGNPTWLDNDYAMAIWAEINQQAPDLPLEDKQSFFREMLDIAWAESHMGADYHKAFREDLPASNRNRQTANMFNAGFNSNRGYDANYDPENRSEMADYAVNQLINTFKVLENKGLKGQYAHNYHLGPNAKFSQVLLDDYLGKMAGSNTKFGNMYSW